ncbi:MAG: hypothetical protein ACOC13_02230, partial [Tangfeifania sp.]
MNRFSRRNFIRTAALAGTGTAAAFHAAGSGLVTQDAEFSTPHSGKESLILGNEELKTPQPTTVQKAWMDL